MQTLTMDQVDMVSGAGGSGAVLAVTIDVGSGMEASGGISGAVGSAIVSHAVQIDNFVAGFLSDFS